jgi:1-acyl-sn-glycerol-3-phosphate acyltransferase
MSKFWSKLQYSGWFVRSVLYTLGEVLSMVFFSVLGQVLQPFSASIKYRFIHYWAKFCLLWLRWTCGVHYRVHGREHIDPKQAGLILARHESTWETYAFQAIFPQQTFVLKRELLKVPFFGWGLSLLEPIAIDRGSGRQAIKQVVEKGTDRLDRGIWVVVFPEGTRMPPGEAGKLKPGAAMLATKAQKPVYLVGHNAGQCWPKGRFVKRPGVIDVHISPPLDVTDKSVSEINQLTKEWLHSHSAITQPAEASATA